MPTVTILPSSDPKWGSASFSNTSGFKVGKSGTASYYGRAGYHAIDKTWYIKSIKFRMKRTDYYSASDLRIGSNTSDSWSNKTDTDFTRKIAVSSGTGTKEWDLTAYKSILQAYPGGWYIHVRSGGDSSYCEFSGGTGSSAPRVVIEYEEATLTVPGDEFTIGTSSQIEVGTSGSGLTHNVSYSIGTESGVIGTGITAGASVNWTPPAALAAQITEAMSGTIRLALESYLSGVLTSTLYYDYTLHVPDSYAPTISSSSFALSNPSGDTIGIYVQGRSRTVCTIAATAQGGASIVEYRLTIGGKSKTSLTSPITSDVLTETGALTATLTVVDSRGLSTTQTETSAVTVYAYAPPIITALSVERALSDGTPSNDGAYLSFSLTCAFSALNGLNTKAGFIKYKPAGGAYGAATSLTSALSGAGGYAFTINGTFGAGDVGAGSYAVLVSLTDRYSTATDEAELSSRSIWIDRHGSGSGVAIGKMATEAGVFDVGLPSRFRQGAQIDGGLAVGSFADPAAVRKALGMGSIIGRLVDRSIPTRGTNLNCYKITLSSASTDNNDVLRLNTSTGALVAWVTGRYRLTGAIVKKTTTSGSIGWARVCTNPYTFSAADHYSTADLTSTFYMPLENSYNAASATAICYTFSIILTLTKGEGVWVYINDSGAAGTIDSEKSSLSMERV